ncbi:MAG: helix-turn-helix domain-containing protein [Pseudomonadota bacterium]
MERVLDIVVADGFPLLSLAFVTEPLRLANRESPRPLFRWRLVSPDGARPRSSSGLLLDVDGALEERRADIVLLLTSYRPDRVHSGPLAAWLRRRAAEGAVMGCVDTGALVFAHAGLLDRYAAAVHPEAIDSFREALGEARFTNRLFDFRGSRCSSAGGVATCDMMLALIRHFASARIAARVAKVLNYQPLTSPRGPGALGRDVTVPGIDRRLAQGVEIMLATLDDPLPVAEIAARAGLPGWQLRRLFQRHFGMSAQGYYLELRLDRARNLLRNSSESVGTVALMCGFSAGEALARAYRARYGVAPSRDRRL